MSNEAFVNTLHCINPLYVEPGQEALAREFDDILRATLPDWATRMDGYAWECELPGRADFQREADTLAEFMTSQHEQMGA